MFLKKAASLCCHSTNVGKEKAMCTEQVELAQSHLVMVCIDHDALQEKHGSVVWRIADLEETHCLPQEEDCQLKVNVKIKSLELTVAEREIDDKSKVLANLEVMPTFSPNDMKELERHGYIC